MAERKFSVARLLRGFASLSFAIAAIVMFVSYQKVDEEYFKFIVRYIDWKGFMLAAIVNCIGCIYNFVFLLLSSGSKLWKTVVALDVIVIILVGTSLGAGWQTYLLINEGNIHARWSPVCRVAPHFCSKILGSLITSTVGFVISMGLLIWVLHESVDVFLFRD